MSERPATLLLVDLLRMLAEKGSDSQEVKDFVQQARSSDPDLYALALTAVDLRRAHEKTMARGRETDRPEVRKRGDDMRMPRWMLVVLIVSVVILIVGKILLRLGW